MQLLLYYSENQGPCLILLFNFFQDGLTPLELCLRLGHHARTYELIKLLKTFRGKKQHDSVYLEGV
jgi:hypothetical protein